MKVKSMISVLITLILTMAMSVVGLTATAVPASATGGDDNTNSADYWAGKYPGSTCNKFEGNGTYGMITNDGNAVTLKPLGVSMYYTALIVKGGSVDTGDGPGNVVYKSPVAGTAYVAPINGGGQRAAVSHWIVCTAQKAKPAQPPTSGTETGTDSACTSPRDGTLTVSTWTKSWTQTSVFNETSWSWTLGAKMYGDKVITGTTKSNAAICAPATTDTVIEGWYTWQTPNYVPDTTKATLVTVGLPQVYVGKGQLVPTVCGVTYQQDYYKGTTSAIAAILADGYLRGTLESPEDHAVVTEWKFVSSQACAQPATVITDSGWTKFTPTCTVLTGTETNTKTTTTYVWTNGAWVRGADLVVTESRTVTMTDADFAAKCKPVMPTKDSLVVLGQYGGAEPTCTTPSVMWTRTITTTTYSYEWNTGARKWDETETPVVTTDTVKQTKALSADQVKACSINLTLTKSVTSTGDYFGGSNVTYSLVPHNDGPAVAMAGWSVTEVLPEGSTLIRLSGDGYDCLLSNLVCTSRDALAAGAYGKAITAIVEIPEGVTGSFKNVAYVSPSSGDVAESNPLVVPTISTDTASTPTDNDAEGVVTVLAPEVEGITITLPDTGVVTVSPPQVEGVTITLPNTGATIPLTWFLGGIGLLAAGLILVGASRFGARSRKS